MKKILLFLWLAGVGACVPVRVVDTKTARDANLATYKSFGFYDVTVEGTPGKNYATNLDLLKASITHELTARGYTVATADPDMLVNIGVVIQDKVQTRETNIRDAPVYMGQRSYHWESQEVVVDRYKEGTVTIDLVDRVKNEMVWKGVAAGTITDDAAKGKGRIDKAMDMLFRKFPVPAK